MTNQIAHKDFFNAPAVQPNKVEIAVGRALTVERALRKIQGMVAEGFESDFSLQAYAIQQVLRDYEKEAMNE